MIHEQIEHHTSSTRSWLAAQEAERMGIALRVYPIAIGVMSVLALFFTGIYFRLDRSWQWTWMMFEMLQAVVLLSIAYLLVRRERLSTAIYLTTITLNVTVIIGPALVEGMIVPGILASLIAFTFARLIAGSAEKRLVTLITAAALVVGIILSGFQVFEVLPIPDWIHVVTGASGAVVVIALMAAILDMYNMRYQVSLTQAETYANELHAQRTTLEEHTRELTRRTHYLEATAQVARDSTSVLDLEQLLPQVAMLISDRFGFYHAGIFLLDPANEWAVLRAASSEGGRRMLAQGHRLRVGEEGIVGFVTGTGEHRMALDVGTDAVYFDNPDLPETRSELTLPLRAQAEIIGALDVQSTEPNAFTAEDIAVLQTLADLVAMAISNARLFKQVQESLEAERQAYGQLTREAWVEHVRHRANLGYRYSQSGVTPLNERKVSDSELPHLTLPVTVRGQAVGKINAHKPSEAGDWTADEIALVEALTDQLALALESARLYQDTQLRAAQEQLISEVTARAHETLDVDNVLEIAARQMREALGLAEVEVRIGSGPALTELQRERKTE